MANKVLLVNQQNNAIQIYLMQFDKTHANHIITVTYILRESFLVIFDLS